MKRIIAIILTAAAFLAAENTADAQLLKNLVSKVKGNEAETTVAEPKETASTNGQATGMALRSLYTQYKLDGKLDMGNITNLMNLATLATNVKGLKEQTSKTAFYKDFAAGLVLGSKNLVTETNSTSVMNGLTSLVNNVDLSSLTKKVGTTTSAIEDKVESASEKVNAVASNVSGKVESASEKVSTTVENATEIANAVTNILNIFNKK